MKYREKPTEELLVVDMEIFDHRKPHKDAYRRGGVWYINVPGARIEIKDGDRITTAEESGGNDVFGQQEFDELFEKVSD